MVKALLLQGLSLPAARAALSIDNGVLVATIEPSRGLVGLAEKHGRQRRLSLKSDSWSLDIGGSKITAGGCQLAGSTSSKLTASLQYSCGDFHVQANYSLPQDGAFVEKRLGVHASQKLPFEGATLLDGLSIDLDGARDGEPSTRIQENPFAVRGGGPIAAFLRWDADGSGAFVSVANPWAKYATTSGGCMQGQNHGNDDLPNMPLRGMDKASCKQACVGRQDCAGFVFLEEGCEAQASAACYLKSNADTTSSGEGCSCLARKPFAEEENSSKISASYSGKYTHDPALEGPLFRTEPLVLGFTNLTQYTNEGVNTGERIAFNRCVESYHMDSASRASKTVKVNVAWDENDYQIDVGTEQGRTEYKRIIDRNAEFGVTHIVYEPRNTLHSSRFMTTDGWGWEETLWFGMGEKLRNGTWDPRLDDVPEDIKRMVEYAEGKGVKLLAYAYPCLPFDAMKEHFVAGAPNALSLAAPQVQQYFIDVMSAFMEKSGSAGWAWDHDIFAGGEDLSYSQWRAWMNILAILRERFPDMVMDHRQTNHAWGPWYQLAGSYAEPIAGDENPETYGVPIPSLHTDHVAADNTRKVNYVYSTKQLLPPSRIPGFIFHQSERTDDDSHFYCSKDEKLCVNNSNTRDFDYLGYKYSLMSNIGTAGQNNVLTMIPARDMDEFTLLPHEDVKFIRSWLAWTDTHIAFLKNTQWIATLPAPQLGSVDGTHSMLNDEGFIFLFNPNMVEMNVTLNVDESIGLSNASVNSRWKVSELFPYEGAAPVATWKHGEKSVVTVGGSSARVLALVKTTAAPVRIAHAGPFAGNVILSSDGLEVLQASAPAGSTANVPLLIAASAAGALAAGSGSVSVNGVKCAGIASVGTQNLIVDFDGTRALRAMPVSGDRPIPKFIGGWFNTSFSLPQAVAAQLRARDAKYPVPWTRSAEGCGQPHCVDDSRASWLIPSRALMQPFLAKPSDDMDLRMYLDGEEVPLVKSYNSRGVGGNRCFLGWYFDASQLVPDQSHALAVSVPTVDEGGFQGVFWENVETEYSDLVVSCHVPPKADSHLTGTLV